MTSQQGIEEVVRRLQQLERRVAALEASAPGPDAISPVETGPTASIDAIAGEQAADVSHETLPLIGRTLLVLAGAFVLRAVTEAGTLNQIAGTALGLAYSVLWFVLADRSARRGRKAGAVFYGLAGSIIAFPLLVEATVRFEVLSPLLAALLLSGLLAFALTIAARRGLQWLAWVVSGAGAIALLALAGPTKMWILFVALLLVLALADLWLGYLKGWKYLGWMLAALVDAALLLLGIVVLRAAPEKVEQLFAPAALVGLQLAVVVGYFGSFFARTTIREEEVSLGESVQGFVLLPICLGGALAIVHQGHASFWLPGLAALLLAGGCYAAAFAVMDRALGRRRNFVFYSTSALAFTLVAAVTLLTGPLLVYALAGLAVAAAWLGGSRHRATLSLHGAIYVVAAAVGSAMPLFAIDALSGAATPARSWIGLPVLAVVLASAVYCWYPVATHGRTLGVTLARFPKFTVLAVLTLALGGIAATIGAELLPRGEEGQISLAFLAPLRTLILAGAAILMAWLGRMPRLKEATWLVYPLLLAGGLHLLMEDLPTGRPLTLVVSFALYGSALILSPTLLRRARRVSQASSQGRDART